MKTRDVVLAAVALALGPSPTAAQANLEIGAGATGWTEVVRDSITGPISIGFDPGFTAAFRLGTRLDSVHTLQIGLQLTRSTMTRDSEGATAEVTAANIWFPTVSLSRSVSGGLRIRGLLGALIYDPSDRIGTPFADGAPIAPAAGAGLVVPLPFANRLAIDLSWDVHRFTTGTLRNIGFGGGKLVHRVTALLQLGGLDER